MKTVHAVQRRAGRLLTGALLAGLLGGWGAGCASAPTVGQAAPTEPVAGQVVELEAAQVEEVARFDEATAGDDRCARLCFHLDKICQISERICRLAAEHPAGGAQDSCDRSKQTCADTTERLPPECACEAVGDE